MWKYNYHWLRIIIGLAIFVTSFLCKFTYFLSKKWWKVIWMIWYQRNSKRIRFLIPWNPYEDILNVIVCQLLMKLCHCLFMAAAILDFTVTTPYTWIFLGTVTFWALYGLTFPHTNFHNFVRMWSILMPFGTLLLR